MDQMRLTVLYNKQLKSGFFLLALEAPQMARKAAPGQFLNIRITDGVEPLLRRPLSIHRVTGKNIELLYQVVGQGTLLLAQKQAGDKLDIIGPLGKGFDYLKPITYNLKPILIAGGMGVAPLVFLAESISRLKPKTRNLKPIVLIGAKTKSQILCRREFIKAGCTVKIATDDGSRGFKGYVSELLTNLLLTIDQRPLTIYACGPHPMLREVARIAAQRGIPAQVSLEAHMACGIGACLGCAVKVKGQGSRDRGQGKDQKGDFEYKRVCKEGPVFAAREILWEE